MTSPIDAPSAPNAPSSTLRLSTALSALCLLLIVGGPILTAAILTLHPEIAAEGMGVGPVPGDPTAPIFSTGQHVIIILVGLLPMAFITYGLIRARRCFRSFARGEYFTADVVGNLRGFAAGIGLWVVAGWLSTPLMSVLLTLGAEEHRLTVSFSSNGLLTLLFAGIVWQIAEIMRRAAALAEENAQFV
jgi:hypothetical protein